MLDNTGHETWHFDKWDRPEIAETNLELKAFADSANLTAFDHPDILDTTIFLKQ